LNGRQILLQHPVLVEQLKPSELLKARHIGRSEFSRIEQVEPIAQRRLGIFAFKIIGGIERVLPPGLALPPGERAKAVEPPGNRRGKA
jgi:hypothetical protein